MKDTAPGKPTPRLEAGDLLGQNESDRGRIPADRDSLNRGGVDQHESPVFLLQPDPGAGIPATPSCRHCGNLRANAGRDEAIPSQADRGATVKVYGNDGGHGQFVATLKLGARLFAFVAAAFLLGYLAMRRRDAP